MTMGITSPTSTTGQILKNGSAVISFDANNNATFSGNVAPSVNPTMRNRIINGAMMIDQRNAGVSKTITDTSNYTYTLDRWGVYGSQASKFSVQQNAGSVTPPTGFTKYLGVTSLSAYSILSTDRFEMIQGIEGVNTADLGWGTANAKTVTLSFQVYSSLTGTFGGSIQNSAGNRSYPFSFTISSANTWEQKTVTITGDTTGTWTTDTTAAGIYLNFSLGVGSNRSGTAGAWAAANYTSATGATSVVGTNGATFYITGVQLEAGSVATPFEQRLYGQEFINCQRYYYRLTAPSSGSMLIFSGINAGSTSQLGSIYLPVSMRAIPTLSAGANAWGLTRNNGSFTTYATNSVPSIANSTNQLAYFYAVVASGLTGATMGTTYIELGNWIDFSAEL
jgi:hypothetical protein